MTGKMKMNSFEAMEALREGRKVRFIWWPDENYILRVNDDIKGFPDTFDTYIQENPWRVIWLVFDTAHDPKLWASAD